MTHSDQLAAAYVKVPVSHNIFSVIGFSGGWSLTAENGQLCIFTSKGEAEACRTRLKELVPNMPMRITKTSISIFSAKGQL